MGSWLAEAIQEGVKRLPTLATGDRAEKGKKVAKIE
jgi:hypothetical protein